MSDPGKNVLLFNGLSTAFASADNSPSFALMALSAYLKSKGFRTALLKESISDSDLCSALKNSLAVGFSVFTGSGILKTLEMTARIRRLGSDIPFVWGGYHPTLEPDQVLGSKLADYVVRGEGEYVFEDLLVALQSGTAPDVRAITGLSYKKDGAIVHNESRMAAPIDDFPMYDYSLYDHVFRNSSQVAYMSSRGCPFSCKFCCSVGFNRAHGKQYRQMSTEHILRDLESIVSLYSPRHIKILDDNFFIDRNRVLAFVEAYREKSFSFEWSAFARCDFFAKADASLLQQLKETNFVQTYFGVESGSQRVLDMVGKRLAVGDVITATEKLHEHGIMADYSFINGFPNEKMEDVRASVQLRNRIKSLSPKSTATFFVYTPLPATETLEDCVKLGYRKPDNLEGWCNYEYHSFEASWLRPAYIRTIQHISWASLFDNFKCDGGATLLRLSIGILAAISRIRFRFGLFGFAPELTLVNLLYRRKLRRSLVK